MQPAACPCQGAVERIAAEDARADGHHRAEGAEEVLYPGDGILAQILGHPDEAKRIAGWKNPWADPYDGGLQIIQSLIAIVTRATVEALDADAGRAGTVDADTARPARSVPRSSSTAHRGAALATRRWRT